MRIMKYLASDNRLARSTWKSTKKRPPNEWRADELDGAWLWTPRGTRVTPERKFSSVSSTVGRKPHHQPHFSGFESSWLDEKICTFGRHPMYTWFIVEISRPIITQPLREVLKSTEHIWERTRNWNACHFDLFSSERSEATENQFFRMSAGKRAKSQSQEKSFQVHLLHISDVFISTSRATIKIRTWERVLLMHFRSDFHK